MTKGTEINNMRKLRIRQARMSFKDATSSSNYRERCESLVLKHCLLKPLPPAPASAPSPPLKRILNQYVAQGLSTEKSNIQMTVGELAFIAAASIPYFFVLVFLRSTLIVNRLIEEKKWKITDTYVLV